MTSPNERPPRGPRPKKRYGQHFLTDKNIIKKIVRAAGIEEGDQVLEIGPGTGALTEGLIEAGAFVLAIEVDTGLIEELKRKFTERFEVMTADALKLSYTELSRQRNVRFKLVANLPYYISGPILAKLLEEREAFSIMVLMFQKEVGDRIAAGPGGRDYGILSVLSQMFTEVRKEFDVPSRLFFPKPKVDSSVVSFRVLGEPKAPLDDERFFKSVVRSAFGARRKQLVNSLCSQGIEKGQALLALNEAGIDPARRGETLNLNEFAKLAHALYSRRKSG